LREGSLPLINPRPVLGFGALLLCAPRAFGSREASFRVEMRNERTAAVVRRTLEAVSKRLTAVKCRKIFADYRMASGLTLEDSLRAQDQSAATHLATIVFHDGSDLHRCANPNIVALAIPGKPEVHLCVAQFGKLQTSDPISAEAVIIHEQLHTLGLGENPPASREITQRVLAACF